jgi:hypothetical protein
MFPAHAEGTPAPRTAQALYGGTTRGVQVASDPRADASKERLDGLPRFSECGIQYKKSRDGRQECVPPSFDAQRHLRPSNLVEL